MINYFTRADNTLNLVNDPTVFWEQVYKDLEKYKHVAYSKVIANFKIKDDVCYCPHCGKRL